MLTAAPVEVARVVVRTLRVVEQVPDGWPVPGGESGGQVELAGAFPPRDLPAPGITQRQEREESGARGKSNLFQHLYSVLHNSAINRG